jgi:3-methyladenine DNA glycosylase/8-oxoguanine DNA glycosylase
MWIDGPDAWCTARTTDGAATLHLHARGGSVAAEAWGPGADHALALAPGLIGAHDTAEGFEPHHPVIADLWRRNRGLRLTATGSLMRCLIPAMFEQKVTGLEARRAWRGLLRAVGEPAPGPHTELLLPPDPARVAELPSFAFHRFGVPGRRAEMIRGTCARASRIEDLASLPADQVRTTLEMFPGIGPWTSAEVTRLALADADAVSVGDYHLPNLVAWMLAGEPRGTDERMLELLEPYRGQRGRVQRLLEAGGVTAPKFGPRTEVRSIAGS